MVPYWWAPPEWMRPWNDCCRRCYYRLLAPRTPSFSPLDPALQNYILLITILVAFLEAAAQQLSLQPPAVVMGFGGIHSPRSEPDGRV